MENWTWHVVLREKEPPHTPEIRKPLRLEMGTTTVNADVLASSEQAITRMAAALNVLAQRAIARHSPFAELMNGQHGGLADKTVTFTVEISVMLMKEMPGRGEVSEHTEAADVR